MRNAVQQAELEKRRLAEFPQYERPDYFGNMKPWRVALLAEWLAPQSKGKRRTYLDVGCGKGESLDLGRAYHFEAHGCEVVASVCDRPDVDLIAGAQELPYKNEQFDVTSSVDVMEHILEEDVPAVLREISRVTRHAVLFGISLKPGRFHPTIKPAEWWMERIRENMRGTARIIYDGRVPKIKRPYLGVEL